MQTKKSSVLLLLGVLGAGAGCDKSATVDTVNSSTVTPAEQGPWITLNEDKISASGNLFVKDGLGYRVSNDRFSALLKLIASQNKVNFTVTPASLLERGAKVEVTGKDLGEVLTNLASIVALKIEKNSDTEWIVSDPSTADGTSGRVTMNDE